MTIPFYCKFWNLIAILYSVSSLFEKSNRTYVSQCGMCRITIILEDLLYGIWNTANYIFVEYIFNLKIIIKGAKWWDWWKGHQITLTSLEIAYNMSLQPINVKPFLLPYNRLWGVNPHLPWNGYHKLDWRCLFPFLQTSSHIFNNFTMVYWNHSKRSVFIILLGTSSCHCQFVR